MCISNQVNRIYYKLIVRNIHVLRPTEIPGMLKIIFYIFTHYLQADLSQNLHFVKSISQRFLNPDEISRVGARTVRILHVRVRLVEKKLLLFQNCKTLMRQLQVVLPPLDPSILKPNFNLQNHINRILSSSDQLT
jgi:hypothetical protein